MSSPDRSGAVNAPARPPLQLEGTCRFAGCKEQHLHPVTGVPPDSHWRFGEGPPKPRWKEPSFRRRGVDPKEWWYRPSEIAAVTGVSIETVRRWIKRCALKATRAPGGGRVLLIRGADLDEFLRTTNRVYPREEPQP